MAMPPVASASSIPHPFTGDSVSTWRQTTLHVFQAEGTENRFATTNKLSALEEGVDTLARKFGDEVRALLHHHLRQSFPEGKDEQFHCIEPQLSPHLDDHDRPVEIEHGLLKVFEEDAERLPSLPVLPCKPVSTASVANIVNEHGSQSASIADECLFETARQEALANQTKLQRFTRSQYYEWASGVLIAANAVFIGFQTELQAQLAMDAGLEGVALPSSEHPLILWGSALFTMLFTLDLALRWVSEGFFGLFQSADCSWNVLDVIIVSVSLVDSFLAILTWALETILADASVLSSISALRILRVARIVKLAKVIRLMSFFRELRIMIYSILGSMKSLLWLALILGMTFYIFGIFFTSGANTYLEPEQLWKEPSNEGLRESFGTLSRSLLALYMAMSGGRSWGEYYAFLDVVPMHYQAIFLAFLTFTMFAVLNIVTGVFVDSAMRANTSSRQVVIHEELDAKKGMLKDLRDLFIEMDINGDGNISLDEFCSRLDDERVVAYFRALKLDVHDTLALFHLLDADGSEEIDMAEFLDGCYQLQGEARSIDTKVMRLQLQWIVQHLESLHNAQLAQTTTLSQLVAHANKRSRSAIWKGLSPKRSDPAVSNGHTKQSPQSPDVDATVATASDEHRSSWEFLRGPGQSMPVGHNGQTTRVTAMKPAQRMGLLDAHKVPEQQALSTPADAADGHLHNFLAEETNRERTLAHLNGREHKPRIDAFVASIASHMR